MIKKLAPILLCALLAVTFSSCDDCRGLFGKEKIECDNGGTCNGGVCDCLKGYYGNNCELKDFCELEDVICVYGDCIDGVCFCSDGFEGEDCSIETRRKFIGRYWVDQEECVGIDTVYGHFINIEENFLDPTRVYIVNLFSYDEFDENNYGFYSKIEAIPQPNSESFNIPNQQPDDDSRSISGSGTITVLDSLNTTLVIDYTFKNANSKEFSCKLTAKRLPDE